MRAYCLKLLIKLLTKYLGIEGQMPIPPVREHEEQVQKFLSTLWTHPHFLKYVQFRDGRIVFELSGGIGMIERDRADYIRFLGQRVEILFLASQSKKAYELHMRELRRAKERRDRERKAPEG